MRIVYNMVLMNAPKSVKMAGTQNNNGGGVKKQGLAPTIGIVASVGSVYRNRLGCPCPENKFIISTTRACGRPIGGIRRTRC